VETPLSVTVVLDNSLGRLSTLPQNPEVVIKKSLKSHGKEELLLDGRLISTTEWLSMLQEAGLMISSPINFVLQGKAKQAAHLDDRGIFDLYSEIVGTAAYTRSRNDVQDILVGTSNDANKSWEILEDFRESLNELEVDKEDYSKYDDSIKTGNR
jgi:chromosome segregation ATPase